MTSGGSPVGRLVARARRPATASSRSGAAVVGVGHGPAVAPDPVPDPGYHLVGAQPVARAFPDAHSDPAAPPVAHVQPPPVRSPDQRPVDVIENAQPPVTGALGPRPPDRRSTVEVEASGPASVSSMADRLADAADHRQRGLMGHHAPTESRGVDASHDQIGSRPTPAIGATPAGDGQAGRDRPASAPTPSTGSGDGYAGSMTPVSMAAGRSDVARPPARMARSGDRDVTGIEDGDRPLAPDRTAREVQLLEPAPAPPGPVPVRGGGEAGGRPAVERPSRAPSVTADIPPVVIGNIEIITNGPGPAPSDTLSPLAERRRGGRRHDRRSRRAGR